MKPKLVSEVLFVIFILATCAPIKNPAATKTATPSQTPTPVLIEKEQAIQNAIQACNPSYGLQPVEQLSESEAYLTSYKEATGNESPFKNIDSKSLVWVVNMRGKWLLVGGPTAPDPNNPVYWDECAIIIDAQTGESLSEPIE